METGIEGNEDVKEIVHLKQKIDKWQSSRYGDNCRNLSFQ